MGTVRKLASGKWAIRFDAPSPDGSRTQKQIGGFIKKSEAEKELIRLEAEILNGQYFRAAHITVSDFLQIWLNDHVKKNLAPKSQRFYQTLYSNHLKDYFAKVQLVDLRANQVETLYANLKEEGSLGPNSIHHCHKALRAALNYAVRWGYIKESPMSKVTPPKQKKATMRYWEPDAIKQALNLFVGTPIEFHVRIALLTGLRSGEICALHEKNLDFKNGEIHIEKTAQRDPGQGIIFKDPKTDESMATLPMTDEVRNLLKERMLQNKRNRIRYADIYRKEFTGYLSVWEDGSFIEPDYVGKTFHKILARQNQVDVIRFHDLRHSCASWLIQNGVDLKTIQEILRHSDYRLTANTYSHISQGLKKDALEKLKLGE